MDRDELMVLLGEIRGDLKAVLANQTDHKARIEKTEADVANLHISKAKVAGGTAALSAVVSVVTVLVGWFLGWKNNG